MMASPSLSYPSPSDAHSSIPSPAPSQILLKRVASPNHHLVQPQYVDSPRSVPIEYAHYQPATAVEPPLPPHQHQHYEYQDHQEVYVNDDPHMYDFGPNAVPIDPQFVNSPSSQPEQNTNLLYAIQPPTPMQAQFASPIPMPISRPGSPYGEPTDFSVDHSHSPILNGVNGHQFVDISTGGYAISTTYMGLPRSHPMQGRPYYDTPVFDEADCTDRSPSPGIREQVKRPLNAFMLYRKDKQAEIPTSNHQSVSRIIGAMWKSESAETKAKYNTLAQKERELHRLNYPGYKYSPKKRINKDKKVRRTMSQAAHAKRMEEEKAILRQLNRRAKSEGTLAKPLPELLPLPKSKQQTAEIDKKPKSKTPAPDSNPRIMPHVRSHSAQPSVPSSQDYSKITSHPRYVEEPEDLNIAQGYTVPSHMPDHYAEYFTLPTVDYASHNGDTMDTPFDSETDESYTNELSVDINLCSPDPSFTPIDESQIYGGNHFIQRADDIEVFRMNSPFAVEQKEYNNPMQNPRVQDVFGQWSRESTVNPQDLLAQPDNL